MYRTRTHPNVAILALSLVVATLVSIGATFCGTPVLDYGFNVETAGDRPVWHQSETDVLPANIRPDDGATTAAASVRHWRRR